MSPSILVCSLAVDFPTTISIVNKHHFYKTEAAIGKFLIHITVGPVLKPSSSEAEVKPVTIVCD